MSKIESFFKNLAIISIRLYRLLGSPILGGECRFYPSCSEFASQAFSHFSFFSALRLVLKRVFSCHPFHPGGYDPLLRDAR